MGEKCLESTAISRTDICEMLEEGPRELYVKVTGALEREQNDGERIGIFVFWPLAPQTS